MAAVKTLIGNIKGPKGDTGEKGDTGAKGDIGATGRRGSRWNSGTAITGTSTTATIFSGSGISDALVSDMYLNTSTGNTYRCTVSGAASVAKWVYVGNIKGTKGDTGAKGDKGDTGATGPRGPQGEYAAVDSALSATSTNPVQNKVVQAALSNKLGTTGDTKNNIVSFTSADSTSPTAWTDVAVLASGEKHSSLFNKISTMFKNVRYLYKMLGTTDISGIGNGTVTGGLSALNSNLSKCNLLHGDPIVLPSTYTKFTAPNDGYLTLYSLGDNGVGRVCIDTMGTVLLDCPAGTYKFASIFLRKGTSIYLIGDGEYGNYFFSSYTE